MKQFDVLIQKSADGSQLARMLLGKTALLLFRNSVISGMSHRNRKTRDPPHLSSTVIQATKTCAGPHPFIHPSILSYVIHPSIRLSDLNRNQRGWQTWAAVRLSLLLRGPLSELSEGPSEPGVPRQLNLSSGQSEKSRNCPISLHYGTALLLHCHVPVVLQGRRCLIHHQGTKDLAGGLGGGRSFLPLRHTHTHTHTHTRKQSHSNPLLYATLLNLRFVSKLSLKISRKSMLKHISMCLRNVTKDD